MTKRDYQLIASVIRETPLHSDCRLAVARALCVALHFDNPRFDPARFLAACGVGDPQQKGREK